MKKIGNILFLYFFVFVMCMGASFAWYVWKGSEVSVDVNFAGLDPYIEYIPLTIKDSDKNKTLTESDDYTGGIGYDLVFNKNANGDNLNVYGQNYLKVTSTTNSDIFKVSNFKWTLVSVNENEKTVISSGNFVGENVVESDDVSKMIPISIDFSLTNKKANTSYEFYLWLDKNSYKNINISGENITISVSVVPTANTIDENDEMYIRSIEYGTGVINKFVAYSSKYDISGYKIINTETTPSSDGDWTDLSSSNSVVEDATIESGKIVTIKPNHKMEEINNICIKNSEGEVYCKSIGKYSDSAGDKPTKESLEKLCKKDLTYNGKSQQLVSSTGGNGYTLSGYNQKNVSEDKDGYTITAKLNDGYVWKDGTSDDVTFKCSMKKKDLTIKALDQTITYGESISLSAYTYDGLVEGDMLASVNLIPSTSEVTDNGTITPEVGIIMNDDGEDLVDNYNITYIEGKLIIKDRVYQLYDSSGNSTGYAYSLSNAISKVKSGGTIKALKNNSSDAVTIDKNVTLDTNGKTITMSGTITNKANTTITGSGTIYYSTTSTTAKVITNSSGTLTITDSILKSDSRFVITSSSGIVNINGGTYVVNASDCSSGCAPFMPTGGTVNINGGTYQGDKLNYLVINNGGTVNFGETRELTVSGFSIWNNSGTINFKQGTLKDVSNGITAKGGNVNISGGSIGVTSRAIRNSGGKVSISGGEFYTSSTASIKIEDGTVDINGGIYHVNSTDCSNGCAPFEVAGGIVNINSGTYQGDKLNYLVINSGGTVNFGETKELTVSGLSMWNNSGTINFKKGTLKGVSNGITLKGGNVNISGGTISGETTGITIREDGSNPILNITGGSITGTNNAGVYIGSGMVNIGTKDGNVSTTSPNIYSKSYSLKNAGGTWNFYDGALYGANNPTFDKTPAGTESGYYAITVSDSTYGYKTYLGKSYTVTFYKNQDYLEAKNSLIATISGRRFYKTNAGAALVAYVDDGTYTGPLLVSETASAVEYYSPDHTACKDGFTSAGSFTYDGKTYYYSAGSCWMAGSQNDTSGLGRTKYTVTRSGYSEDSAKEAARSLLKDSVGTSTTQSVDVGVSTALKANTYTKDNYTFKGWATSPTGDVVYSDKQSVVNAPTKLYAIWAPKTFALTLTKGTGIEKINYKINGADSYTSVTSTTTVNVNYGTRYIYFGTASTGYTISSCTSTSACGGIMTAAKSVTLSAKLNTYTMTITKNTGINTIYYKVNGASNWNSTTSSTSVSGVEYGTSVTYYYTSSTGYTASKTCTSSSPCTLSSSVTGNLTLSPTATLNTYTIAFNSNGGTGTMSNLAMTYGTAKNLTANSFKKQYTVTYNYDGATGGNSNSSATANYKFVGWTMGGVNLYSKLNLSNNSFTIDNDGMYYVNKSNTGSSEVYLNFFYNKRDDIVSGNDYTEVEVIKTIDYSGSYNFHVGDTHNTTKTQITYGVKDISDMKVGNNYFALKGSTNSSPSLLSRGFITLPANASITIKFRPILIAAKYNNIDMYFFDSSSVKNLTTTNGGKVNLYADWNEMPITLPTPTKTGYTFAGWYTSSSGGTKVGNGGDSYIPTSNITLYARWNVNSYTLTLNKGTGVSTIYYKVNGASSYTSSTSKVSVSVNYGTTYSYYGSPSSGYYMTSCTSSSPCSGTMGTSAVSKSLTAYEAVYQLYNSSGTSIGYANSLSNAISSVSSGGTIKVLKNNSSGAVSISKSMTINTNGYTITMSGAITNSGALTLSGSGIITNSSTNLIENTGTVTINGPTVRTYGSGHNSVLMKKGTVNLKAGIIQSDFYGITSSSSSVSGTITVNITSGTITTNTSGAVSQYVNPVNIDGSSSYKATINISGGTLTSKGYGLLVGTYATATITAGTIENYAYNSSCSGTIQNKGTLYLGTSSSTADSDFIKVYNHCKANGVTNSSSGKSYYNSGYIYAGNGIVNTDSGSNSVRSGYAMVSSSNSTYGYVYHLTTASGWVSTANGWYYYENGSAVTGWKQISSTWYYFNSSGIMQTGWIHPDSYYYYLNSSGAMQAGSTAANVDSGIYTSSNGPAGTAGWYSFTTSGYAIYVYSNFSGTYSGASTLSNWTANNYSISVAGGNYFALMRSNSSCIAEAGGSTTAIAIKSRSASSSGGTTVYVSKTYPSSSSSKYFVCKYYGTDAQLTCP